MSSVGDAGACGPGPTPGPNNGGSGPACGASNPRKFSEKIALHTQRQAEETAAFQEVMMDLTSTRIQAQKVRLARTQGPYYSGSLPNVNQIGRTASDLQGSFQSPLDSSRSTRHHGLVERVHRDRRFISPSRPYRRQIDSTHSSSVYLSPPPDPSWRRNWNSNFPTDKSQIFHQLPTTALNRTNSDSALHTSVMNSTAGDPFRSGHTLTPQNRRGMFSYPVPPIEENSPDDKRLLKPWDSRKFPLLSSRPKSCEVPGITVFPSPDQQGGAPHGSTVLNTGGSLPDLTSLHFPSPLPTPLDPDEPGYPPLSGGNSTGNLTSTLIQLGINTSSTFHSPGLLPSHQGTLSNPSLQSSLSNPNIQSSLSSHSFPNSLSSASLHSSLSNPSIQSSLSSSPSLRSSLSNQSLHSSLSSQSLQSASSNACYSSSGSFSVQPQVSMSPRRRAQLSPVSLTPDTRRHHPKQFSPTISSTLTSITQGVALDTSQLQVDQRLSQYSFSQPQQIQKGLAPAQTGSHTHMPQPSSQTAQLHLQNMQNFQMQLKWPSQNQNLMSYGPADAEQNKQPQDMQVQTGGPTEQQSAQTQPDTQNQSLPPHQQISPSFSSELDFYNDALFLNSLLNDPYLNLQLTGRHNQNQQMSLDSQVEGLNDDGGSDNTVKGHSGSYHCQQGTLELLDSTDQQLLTQNQCSSYSDGRHTVPNVILTGDSSSGLSKEITNALSGVPGFEIDRFSSDDPLRMDPLVLEGLSMLTDGDLMLADPAVEDSFRSDHLK
ncbi:CREB-regulated transcription coactivator 2-like isoform X2 [Myxocyprinus asiaticus]|uniref:CREB-regulated transcription coactivator 2-like isoform X2 n=1 Tax=Myxocyprinus asiaticus TaxID=70543 RepID=UPI0022236ECF|nr:CREB-regulated transcription coactivator 2-like isoform X2 [Myxocyprinus asiaticus]